MYSPPEKFTGWKSKEAVILDFLMERMIQAVLYYDTDRELNAIDSRVLSFISDNYKKAYSYQAEGKSEAEKLYLRLLLVTDYVCGMTDSYAAPVSGYERDYLRQRHQ